MRYIRFLKPPKIQGTKITALVTITSDLGETFYPEAVQLSAALRSAEEHGDIYLRKGLKWTAGMRSLPISLNIEDCDIDWPVRLHVGVRNSPLSDHFEKHRDGSDLPHIISAWSDTLDPPSGLLEATRTVERQFIPLSNRPLRIWEETGESIARHIWDAGIALAAYLDRMIALQAEGLPLVEESLGSATFKRLNVLELGAGCGVVGISLAQSIPDCNVLLTDLPEATTIAERNIDAMSPAMGSSVKFHTLDWEAPLPANIQSRTFDLILIADCTYNPDSAPALVKTLSALVQKSPKAVILVSMKIRHQSELVFFDLMKQANLVERTRVRLPLPEMADQPEDVKVIVFHHRERPSYVGTSSQSDKRVVQFWPD